MCRSDRVSLRDSCPRAAVPSRRRPSYAQFSLRVCVANGCITPVFVVRTGKTLASWRPLVSGSNYLLSEPHCSSCLLQLILCSFFLAPQGRMWAARVQGWVAVLNGRTRADGELLYRQMRRGCRRRRKLMMNSCRMKSRK